VSEEEIKRDLRKALDNIDEAIYLLREVARSDENYAEVLEDILYHLEEAADLLDSLIAKGVT